MTSSIQRCSAIMMARNGAVSTTIRRKKDTFLSILKNNVPARLFATFQRNILRPNNNFGYTQGDATTQCP